MGTRVPATALPASGQAVKSEHVSAFMRWLRELSAVDYADITVTFSASATASADHGLGRAYIGATVLWVSDAAVGVSVLDPSSASAPRVSVDLGTIGGGAFTGTARVRVF